MLRGVAWGLMTVRESQAANFTQAAPSLAGLPFASLASGLCRIAGLYSDGRNTNRKLSMTVGFFPPPPRHPAPWSTRAAYAAQHPRGEDLP